MSIPLQGHTVSQRLLIQIGESVGLLAKGLAGQRNVAFETGSEASTSALQCPGTSRPNKVRAGLQNMMRVHSCNSQNNDGLGYFGQILTVPESSPSYRSTFTYVSATMA